MRSSKIDRDRREAAFDRAVVKARPAPVPAGGDHRAWAVHWGEEAARSIALAVSAAAGAAEERYHAEHAVRAARMAFSHAARLKGYRYWEWTYLQALGKEPK